MDDYIKAFMEGPILPVEVPKEQYDNVMTYLNAIGFLKMILTDVRQEERERAQKIIEEMYALVSDTDSSVKISLEQSKQEALKKLNS